MRHPITTPLFALVAGAGLVVPVQGGTISGTLTGDSTLTPTGTPGIFVQNFTGDGMDTTYGAFTPQSQSTINFSSPPDISVSNGTLSLIFAQGTLLGTTDGEGIASGLGTATVTLDFVITGGTGLFAGAKGDVTITATITQTSPTTESIDGSYRGTLSLVPEPSTLALLAPSAALVAAVVARGRRREVVTYPNG
jgi:hypothetical protein